MTDAPLLVDIDQNGTGWVTLNRPDVHNAFDDVLIAELTAALERLGTDRAVRAVALRAAGKSFSAGGDLNWMRRMAGYSPDENRRDAEGLAAMLGTLSHCAKPTLALVQGAVLGGGVGLVAACDIALAAEEATFCLSEVKLGLIPATIGPYVIAAVGERQARRYALTAERFDAMEAMRIGLVHEVVPAAGLAAAAERMLGALAGNGPLALAATKDLVRAVAGRPIDAEVMAETARRIADIRASDEGREGITAFLEKRKPGWVED
ncbi:MAG: enoyl-CoA hydratase-related protein [Rhodospirillales bacterium]|mgnify:CR=1 FL=1|jgi:methylglutaconyl-CoA hydratase|nr:enoyl-CoA hydratase-related protein [Rhodospirillales bacterium]